MSERSKVWAVTDGEYSDYRVVAVFETEADAIKAMTAGMGDDVTEMDYYATGVKPSRAKWTNLVALVDAKSGDLVNHRGEPVAVEEIGHGGIHEVWRHPRGPRLEKTVEKTRGRSGLWRVAVQGSNTDHTRKVFYDLLAKTRAEIVEGHR